jgi:short-subunit dehydrogenase
MEMYDDPCSDKKGHCRTQTTLLFRDGKFHLIVAELKISVLLPHEHNPRPSRPVNSDNVGRIVLSHPDVYLFVFVVATLAMLPTAATVRNVLAAPIAAYVISILDCNPTLYLVDQWFHRQRLYRSNNNYDGGGRFGTSTNSCTGCVWIVGASSGIGAELAYQIASASVIAPASLTATSQSSVELTKPLQPKQQTHLILSSRSVDKLNNVATRCRTVNPNCIVTVLPLDVCREEDLVRAVQSVKTAVESVDTVVMNAGTGHLSPALETSSHTAESMWRSNALWPMLLIPLLFQHNAFESTTVDDPGVPWTNTSTRQERRRPHIVVTSSIAGILPVPLSSTYAAAKHGLMGYLRSLQAERPDILLHTALPGPVETDFHLHGGATLATTDGVDVTTGTKLEQKSKLKMSVQRCARLIHSTMQLPYSTESWIAQQPVLLALYLQQWIPNVMSLVYRQIGPRRVAMWRAGLDLYDPDAWKQQRTPRDSK